MHSRARIPFKGPLKSVNSCAASVPGRSRGPTWERTPAHRRRINREWCRQATESNHRHADFSGTAALPTELPRPSERADRHTESLPNAARSGEYSEPALSRPRQGDQREARARASARNLHPLRMATHSQAPCRRSVPKAPARATRACAERRCCSRSRSRPRIRVVQAIPGGEPDEVASRAHDVVLRALLPRAARAAATSRSIRATTTSSTPITTRSARCTAARRAGS